MLRMFHSPLAVAVLTFFILLAAAPQAAAQPSPPVRVIAEWEPAVGTLISWPLGIPQELVVELAEDDMLYVLVTSAGAESSAASTFSSWGVDPAKVEYIRTNVETHWPRDWGPHQIFDGNGEWAIIDPIFEGYPWVGTPCDPITSPGGHNGDDAVNGDVAAHFSAPLHAFPAYLTGGNFLVDGHTAAFSTCAMIGENNQLWTEAQFLNLAEDYVGITDYHVVNNTEDNGIQHIDCWFKPLDEETLLVKLPPTWHEEYSRIETNLTQLASATTCYGRSYNIIRIDCPPYDGNNIAAYTNSLILNKKVLVPQFNIPGDAQAIATFEAAMPGYEVIGFPWGSWYYYDALHCRTRAIFDRHMLSITHKRLDTEVPQAPGHTVTALIDDRSESGLIAGELRLYWRISGAADWSWLTLTATGETDSYSADIPGQLPGAMVEYYLAAADTSGRSETLPRTAPDGFHTFTVVDSGLTITAIDPPQVLAPGAATAFSVTIDPGDEALVPGTETLHWRLHGGAFSSTTLTPAGGSQYTATLPPAACGDTPEFYLSAMGDNSGLKTDPPGAPAALFTAEVGELTALTFFTESFESGVPAEWNATGLWQATGSCAVSPPPAGTSWAYYGQSGSCNYDTGARTSGELTAPLLTLPTVPAGGSILLGYFSNLETENEAGYDTAGLYINGMLIDTPAESAAWESRTVDLMSYAGQEVTLEWRFDSIDDYYNTFHGWQMDGIWISSDELQCLGLSVAITCTPASGTLPFTTAFTVRLDNPQAELTRRVAGRVDVDLAGGGLISSWRAGYTNLNPGASYVTGWNQALPALPSLVGISDFRLYGMDVTPAPYNQPPYPPAGASASDSCTVTGFAP